MNKRIILNLVLVNYILTLFSGVWSCSQNCTRVERSIEKILHRKKRFLIFPPLSNVLITGSIVKAIIITAPKGYNLLGEVDFYYPLPSKARYPPKKQKEHTPRPLPPPTTPAPPPPPPSMMKSDYPLYFDHNDNNIIPWKNDHPGEVYIKPPQSTPYNRRNFWEDQINRNENFSLRRPETAFRSMYTIPPVVPIKRINLKPLKFQQLDKTYKKPYRQPAVLNQPRPVGYAANYYLPRGRSLNLEKVHHVENMTKFDKKRSLNDIDDHEDWEHYYAHKDRQDLYTNLQKVFKS